jgi:hypothetical protein
VAMRRRDECGTIRLPSSRAPPGPAERAPFEQSAVLLSPMSALQHTTDSSQTSREVRLGHVSLYRREVSRHGKGLL